MSEPADREALAVIEQVVEQMDESWATPDMKAEKILAALTARWQLVPIPAYPSMRQAMAEEMLNISSHRDEYRGIDLPGGYWGWAYSWSQDNRNPDEANGWGD